MSIHRSPTTELKSKIFLYGPPGSGKSTIGRQLAKSLKLPFYDLDEGLQARLGKSIPQIFAEQGESGFRRAEKDELNRVLDEDWGVIALGGGALLDPENRERVTSAGRVLCLTAADRILLERLEAAAEERPLLAGDAGAGMLTRLKDLLAERGDHYAAFPLQLDTTRGTSADLVWNAQVRLGAFHVSGMGNLVGAEPAGLQYHGYDVRVQPDSLKALGEAMRSRRLQGPIALVTDENVAALHLHKPLKSLQEAGYIHHPIIIPSGESSKDVSTLAFLWEAFLELGLERGSTMVALGGGVVGDLAGFAAATYKRGISWIAVPTTLLAMADASLGGKTAIDLVQGKNLIGAFHAPRMVLTDPITLKTLPPEELRSGLAEVVKAGIIGDPTLFSLCARGLQEVQSGLDEIVRRSMAVKIRVIEMDPFEHGIRASLNLGHTIGHAIELLTDFDLKHGEAVAIGMVAEARLAEQIDLAEEGLSQEIGRVLQRLGLPTEIPEGLDRRQILTAMQVDKKRSGGKVRFALPVKIGEVEVGVEVGNLSEAIL